MTYSDSEYAARDELAQCYNLFAALGWTEGIYNHITVSVPDEPDAYLINPFGLNYNEVTIDNLVKVDLDGNILCGSKMLVNKAGLVQHGVFHRGRPDAQAIIHTHTTETQAVCCFDDGLLPISFSACFLSGRVSYHEFEGITVRDDEGPRLLESLGNNNILMLRNHGPVVMGKTLAAAFFEYLTLQRACEVQLATLAMGKPRFVCWDVIAQHQNGETLNIIDECYGQVNFDAMVRLHVDASWKR